MAIPYRSRICQFDLTNELSANCSSVVIRKLMQRFFPIKSVDNPSAWCLTYKCPIISCTVTDCTFKLEAQWEEPVSLTFHSPLRKLNTVPS